MIDKSLAQTILIHMFRARDLLATGSRSQAEEELNIVSLLTTLKEIMESGDCNTCAAKYKCQYVPKPGERTRYNCPLFQKAGEAE